MKILPPSLAHLAAPRSSTHPKQPKEPSRPLLFIVMFLVLSTVISCTKRGANDDGSSETIKEKHPDIIVYKGTITIYYDPNFPEGGSVTEEYTLKLRTDFSAASINGPMTELIEYAPGIYMWNDGPIAFMRIQPTASSCTIYGPDGDKFGTLYKSGVEYFDEIDVEPIEASTVQESNLPTNCTVEDATTFIQKHFDNIGKKILEGPTYEYDITSSEQSICAFAFSLTYTNDSEPTNKIKIKFTLSKESEEWKISDEESMALETNENDPVEKENTPDFTGINLTTNLISFYSFSGTANDNIGNNHGQVNGPTLTFDRKGKKNSAYLFDGVDDFIQIPHSNDLNLLKNFSLSLWFKSNGCDSPCDPPGYHTLIMKRNASDGFEDEWPWGLAISYVKGGSGFEFKKLAFSLRNNGLMDFVTSNNSIVLNQWQHVAIVVRDNKVLTYLNGKLDLTQELTSIRKPNSKSIFIGWSRRSGHEQFKGTIDDIRVYSRAINSEEVSALFNE